MDRAVLRGLERRSLNDLEVAGMDEKSFLRGQSFVSLLYDLKKARVIDVMQGRDKGAAWLLWDSLPEEVRAQIQAVSIDMSAIYLEVAQEMVPHAAIVHDRYHVSSHLSKAVGKIHSRENAALQKAGDDRLKGIRQLFLFTQENLPESKSALFSKLKQSDLRTGRAHAINENFRHFWENATRAEAHAFFNKWYAWAICSRIEPIKKVARMLKAHLENLLTFADHPITNAVAEGLNSKIQSLRSAARGFRNFLHYRTRILFFCGKLDLNPLYLAKNRRFTPHTTQGESRRSARCGRLIGMAEPGEAVEGPP